MVNSELIILGMIYLKPGHGYALKKNVKEYFGNPYFKLNNNVLYSTLKNLEENGFIEGEEITGEKINKKIYHITENGKKHLTELIATPAQSGSSDFDFKVQAVFFDLISEERRVKVIKPIYQAKLEIYQEALEKKKKYGSDMPYFSFKVLEYGIKELELSLKFYKELIDTQLTIGS
ncbi:MAG TPA: PadR family transcriptional regulator [Methanobacterium sp.]|nr:PadR family transcriptional regulator [Methanobacterium sp.]